MSTGTILLTATPTVSNGVAYASGDLIGTKMTFGAGIEGFNQPFISAVGMSDLDKQNAAMTLILFDNDPSGTTFTDNAVLDIADADLPKVVGIFPIAAANYAGFNDSSYFFSGTAGKVPLVMRGSTLYGCLLSGGTPTYTSTSAITVQLFVSAGNS